MFEHLQQQKKHEKNKSIHALHAQRSSCTAGKSTDAR
jgi:hypothetical protein